MYSKFGEIQNCRVIYYVSVCLKLLNFDVAVLRNDDGTICKGLLSYLGLSVCHDELLMIFCSVCMNDTLCT